MFLFILFIDTGLALFHELCHLAVEVIVRHVFEVDLMPNSLPLKLLKHSLDPIIEADLLWRDTMALFTDKIAVCWV